MAGAAVSSAQHRWRCPRLPRDSRAGPPWLDEASPSCFMSFFSMQATASWVPSVECPRDRQTIPPTTRSPFAIHVLEGVLERSLTFSPGSSPPACFTTTTPPLELS